jgi:transcriptional regulator with XRE-family HTH domain
LLLSFLRTELVRIKVVRLSGNYRGYCGNSEVKTGTYSSALQKMPKFSELREIREALSLNQEEMGKALGVGQSGYQRWESAPDSPSAREALEKAKALYKRQMKKEWVSRAPLLTNLQSVSEAPQQNVSRMLPWHIEEAWVIVHEAATAGRVDVMGAEDQREIGEVIAMIAAVLASGSDSEGRTRLVRMAERILLAQRKPPP